MTPAFKLLWALTAIAAIAFAGLYIRERSRPIEVQPATELIRANLDEVREQGPAIDQLQTELADARAEIDGLRKRLEQAENLVGVLEESVDEAAATPAPADPAAPKDSMREMMANMKPDVMARM